MSAITDDALQAAPATKARGYWATVGRRITRDKVSMACALILVLILISEPKKLKPVRYEEEYLESGDRGRFYRLPVLFQSFDGRI